VALIDPNALAGENSTKSEVRKCGSGRKTLVPVGYEHRTAGEKPVVDIRYVCVEDHEGNGDEGAEVTDTFWLNSPSLWVIASWALAMGQVEPFDPEVGEDLTKVLMRGAVTAQVGVTERNGYTGHEIKAKAYTKASIETDPATQQPNYTSAQRDMIAAAEKRWTGYLRWRSQNPRGGNAPTGSTQQGSTSGASAQTDYSDIPF